METEARRELAVVSGYSALLQSVAHWFPWNRAVGSELQPPYSYVVGTGIITVAFTSWALRRERLTGKQATVGLLAITVASGAAVILGYVIDSVLGWAMRGVLGRRHEPQPAIFD